MTTIEGGEAAPWFLSWGYKRFFCVETSYRVIRHRIVEGLRSGILRELGLAFVGMIWNWRFWWCVLNLYGERSADLRCMYIIMS